MKQVIKETTDEDLIKQFLEKGGKVSRGKTKPMPSDWASATTAGATR